MASKLFMRRAVIAALVVAALAASKPASAQEADPAAAQYQCMSQLSACYYWAAAQAGFWGMWAAGIDCELQMADCIRRAIMGR